MNKNKQNNQRLVWKSFFGAIIGSIMVFGLLVFLNLDGEFFNSNTSKAYSQESNNTQTLNDFESAIMGAVDVAGDAVVSVSNLQNMNQISSLSEFYSGFYGNQGGRSVDLEQPDESLELAGSGSGVVYKIEGDIAYVITNNHVVDGADKLQIITANGETVDAELVGKDAFTDLAVLKISSEYVKTTMAFANSDELKVGSLAIAIGSPLGSQFSNSVTQGIVSGVDRPIDVDLNGDGNIDWQMSLLQTDAAINPGNSGGALINKNGQLIGINSNKYSSTKIEGMGFAIPSNQVQHIIAQLEQNGEVIRPVLGISGVLSLSEISSRSKVEVLGVSEDSNNGVVITDEITGGSSAEKAGLQKYDIITKIDDVEINNLLSLRQELYKRSIGDTITLTIIREGQEQTIEVTLESQENMIVE